MLDLPIDNHRGRRKHKPRDWSVSRVDVGLAFGVALAVFSGVSLFAGDVVRAFGPADIDAPTVNVFAYEPTQFGLSYGQTRFTDDNPMAMMLTMRMTPQGPDPIDGALQESCLQRLNGNAARYAQENGMVPLNTQTGARFLVCSLQVFKERLCEAPYRNRIVAQLEEFVRAQRASADKAMALATAKTSRAPVQFVPPILAEQLRALSDVSLISQVDFPQDVPEELKPYLRAKADASPCV